MSEPTNSQVAKGELADKEYLYGRYQSYGDERAKQDLKNRQWQGQLHKQMSHKALDEPMMGEEMGDIKVQNTGISGKALLGLAAIALPLMGIGGAGASVLLNQWISRDSPPPVERPADNSDTLAIPGLKFGPERK